MAEKVKSIPAIVIKRLGSQAPKFTLAVPITLLDGTLAQVNLDCKALRKTEWAKLRDDVYRNSLQSAQAALEPAKEEPAADAKPAKGKKAAPAPAAEPAAPSFIQEAMDRIAERGMEAGVRDGLKNDTKLIMQFAEGWDLEDEFTEANLQALEDEFGGTMVAAVQAYDRAIYQGRLGN